MRERAHRREIQIGPEERTREANWTYTVLGWLVRRDKVSVKFFFLKNKAIPLDLEFGL